MSDPYPTRRPRGRGCWDSGGLRIDLRAGQLSDVKLGSTRRRFVISYNRGYPGPTGDQKANIVIRASEPNQPDLVVALDAKYRVDATPDFRARFGAPGPPIDAINALHRYRDVGGKTEDFHQNEQSSSAVEPPRDQ